MRVRHRSAMKQVRSCSSATRYLSTESVPCWRSYISAAPANQSLFGSESAQSPALNQVRASSFRLEQAADALGTLTCTACHGGVRPSLHTCQTCQSLSGLTISCSQAILAHMSVTQWPHNQLQSGGQQSPACMSLMFGAHAPSTPNASNCLPARSSTSFDQLTCRQVPLNRVNQSLLFSPNPQQFKKAQNMARQALPTFRWGAQGKWISCTIKHGPCSHVGAQHCSMAHT